MLNKTTKSEEERRLDAIVASLITIDFTPDSLNKQDLVNQQLAKMGLQIDVLSQMGDKDLVDHLIKFHLGWNHLETFADFLVKWSKNEGCFKSKAKYIYQYIQDNSKAFSFDIMNKLSQL